MEVRPLDSKNRAPQSPPPPQLRMPAGNRHQGYGETFTATPNTGSATVTIPLPLIAARGAPSLALHYTHGTQDSPFGLGFNLTLPTISRRTEKAIPRYDDRDIFLGPDGQELTPGRRQDGSGDWVPETWSVTEAGVTYLVTLYRNRVDPRPERIERWQAPDGSFFWKMRDGHNGVAVFGRSAQARIADPAQPWRVYQWLVEESRDADGNAVQYRYKAEDGAGWTGWHPPGGFANRYVEAISYGNYQPSDGAPEAFAFELRFDWGEYEGSLDPVRPWPVRLDPYMTCRPGFPLQTLRLCRNLLLINHLPEVGGPLLARRIALTYQESPIHTQLAGVTVIGYRWEEGVAESASLPTLSFTYEPFDPAAAAWRPLDLSQAQPLVEMVNHGSVQLVDLYGEGLPGVLAAGPAGNLYYPPLGEGQFGQAQPLPHFPNTPGLEPPRYALEDVDGNGHLSLVVLTPETSGFFYNQNDGTWAPFRPFANFPPEATSEAVEWADLNGDGRSDLLVPLPGQIRFYLSEGEAGFAVPVPHPLIEGLPALGAAQDERTLVTFGDPIGDGLSHLVRVADGVVTVWPNLGYGQFAPAIQLGGAPRFGPELRPNRIMLGDFSGGGRADLLLVYATHLELYQNQSGQSFAAPIRIPVPGGVSPLDQVMGADARGRGQSGLALFRAGPTPAPQFLSLNGDRFPYLMTSCANGMGGETAYRYRASTEYYLADRRIGKPWLTRLATPVAVVDRVVHRDLITGLVSTEVYQYRDGYFDPVERLFRGFGSVQALNTEAFDPETWHFAVAQTPTAPASMAEALTTQQPTTQQPTTQQPTTQASLTRHWFDVGALDQPALLSAYRREYFQGDPQAVRVGPSYLVPAIWAHGGATVRQARVAQAGQELHSEVYAVDSAGRPAPVPLQVVEHSYTVDLVQPVVDGRSASFTTLARETVTSQYEGVADDPRVTYSAVLGWSRYGHPERTVTVYYPRRNPALPAQGDLRVTVTDEAYITIDTLSTYLIDPLYERQEWELAGLVPDGHSSYESLQQQVTAAMHDPVSYGQPFTGGAQARRFGWTQVYFWDGALQTVLPLGQSGPQALLYQEQEAVFPVGYPAQVFGARVDQTMLTEGGYFEADGHWWRATERVYYHGPEGYYQPRAYQSPFQTESEATTVTYDQPYWLQAVTVTDGLGYRTQATPDYQALQPLSITDQQSMVTEGRYDPFGELMLISQHAQVEGAYRGAMTLANYQPQPLPTLAELLADPDRYLQGAQAYFLRAYDRWTGPGSQPTVVAAVEAQRFTESPTADRPVLPPAVALIHLDGMGRTIERLERVEAAAAPGAPATTDPWLWLSTHRIDYDEQGHPARDYLPAFQVSPSFEPVADRPYTLHTYDAEGREIRTDLPKGFFTQTVYRNAWTVEHWDEDDTVKESAYYQAHINDPKLSAEERRALEMAAGFNATPTTDLLDPQGFKVAEDRLNREEGQEVIYRTNYTVDIRGQVVAAADPRLGAVGAQNLQQTYDMLERHLVTKRVDAGTTYELPDALDQAFHQWTALGAHQVTRYDQPLHRQVREEVDGVVVSRQTWGTESGNLSVNRVVERVDQAGIERIDCYDLLGHPVRQSRTYAQHVAGVIDWADPAKVPLESATWTTTWTYDTEGRVVAEGAPDGSVIQSDRYEPGWLKEIRVVPAGQAGAPVLSGLTYLASGVPVTAAYGNQVALSWSYDPLTLDRIGSTAKRPADGQLLQGLTFTLDPVGNLTAISDAAQAQLLGRVEAGSVTKEFTFDALYRLHGATGPTKSGATYEQRFSYDRSGNLTLLTQSSGETILERPFAVAADSDRSVPASMIPGGGSVDQFFDAAGNLKGLGDGRSLAYDWENRLLTISATAGGDPIAWYRYDAIGERRRRRHLDHKGQPVDLFYLGTAFVEQRPGSDPATYLLVRGLDQDLLLFGPTAGSAEPYRYYLSDRVGSITMALDQQAAVLQVSDYYPYGAPTMAVSMGGGAESPVDLGFAGKERDPGSGFNYFGGRYYLPDWGRWLTPDPAGEVDGLNLYLYVLDNPITHQDPTGFGIVKTVRYGKKGAKWGSRKFGGVVRRNWRFDGVEYQSVAYFPRRTNTGVGLKRRYPFASVKGYVRGHLIAHADTVRSSPASGGLLSTYDKRNYYLEHPKWGMVQRNRREAKAREREMPVAQVNYFSNKAPLVKYGMKRPDDVYFIELTSLAKDTTYSASKKYSVKAYHIPKNYDYSKQPSIPGTTRRRLSNVRVYELPSWIKAEAQKIVTKAGGPTIDWTFK